MKKIHILFSIGILCSVIFAEAQTNTIKVSSFNIRYDNKYDVEAGNDWRNRYPVISQMILFYDMDIVGTQECLKHQIDDLHGVLSKYQYDVIGRGREQNPNDGEHSAIFYKSDKYELLDNGDFWLSETPDIPSIGWDAALNRICTWSKFKEKSTGFVFFMYNVHFDHVGVKARYKSAELILDKIRLISKDSPSILTGDFNVDQNSESYKVLISKANLIDSYLVAPIKLANNGTFHGFDINQKTNQRIDHVFVTPHFSPIRYGVLTDNYWSESDEAETHVKNFPFEAKAKKSVPRYPSDHYPILVQLKY